MTKTYIYRIIHYKNLPFILQNGLHAANSPVQDPGYINIGHRTLIQRRDTRKVDVSPHGFLADYVPFYFTKKAPMLLLIRNKKVIGFDGSQDEIIYLVSSVERIGELKLPFVFTDRHAVLEHTTFYNNVVDLPKIDWGLINAEYWANTEQDNQRKERKQAEFLVHHHAPVESILGIVCVNESTLTDVKAMLTAANSSLQAIIRQDFFYL